MLSSSDTQKPLSTMSIQTRLDFGTFGEMLISVDLFEETFSDRMDVSQFYRHFKDKRISIVYDS